jgi:hypothetical protein
MNATASVTSSSDASYATALAQAAKLKRSLYSIGNAIESGDLSAAGSKLTSLMKEHPEYAAASGGTTDAKNPINDDFKGVSDAIAKNDADGAKTAWTKLKSDLSSAGVKLSDGAADTAKIVADNKAAMNQSLMSALFSSSSNSDTNMLSTLLGSSSSASSGSDSISATLSNWMTYQSKGSSTAATSTAGSILDSIA